MMSRTLLSGLLGLLLVSVGCSAGQDDEDASGGAASGGGSANGGGTTAFGDGGNGAFSSEGGGTSVGGGCAGVTHSAQKVPLDIYIMQDQSGSMSETAASGDTKWEAVTSAITSFVNQPAAAGVGVGIQYFPVQGSGPTCSTSFCTTDADCGGPSCGPCMLFGPMGFCSGFNPGGDSCEAVDYSMPDVEIAPLPGNASAIIASMGNHGPTGGTPTEPALQGAIDHAKAWANFNVGHAVIVVLATDGDPEGCNSELAAINQIATAGATGTPSILTFVIGVGGSVGALNGIAAAGGTGTAFMIDQDPNVEQAFLDALNTIQGQAIPCAFLIPEPPQGEDIDFGEINVQYTPSSGAPTNLPYVASADQCPASGLGWYYDNPQTPTQIMLCPSTCTTVSEDTGGEVKIVVGCDTIAT